MLQRGVFDVSYDCHQSSERRNGRKDCCMEKEKNGPQTDGFGFWRLVAAAAKT